MKKIIFIIIAVIGFNSCSKDFLKLTPETSESSATFYTNETQFQQALVATYEKTRSIAFNGIFMDEMRSDNSFFTMYPGDRGPYESTEVIAEFLDTPTTNSYVNSRWVNDYSGIARANTILTRIVNVDFAAASKDKIIGEAQFLRAYYYYDLVTHFGMVPLQLVEVTSEEGAFLPKSSIDDVYKQIIVDLTSAIAKLDVVATFPQTGRASKGAAKMLLAYAYMSKPIRDYVNAEKELRDITQMNYALLPDYASVYVPANKNNKESIFDVQYLAGDLGQQCDFIWRFIPKTTNTEFILGIHANNYAYTSGGWNVPTQEMVNSYEAGDLRLDASIAVAEGTKSGDNFTTEAVKSIVGYTPTLGKTYYYFVKKYLHTPYAKEYNTNDNFPVFRYSGALLLLAECLAEQTKAAQALPYLNQVRSRAGLLPLASATKENIALEMRHELAFENHRWTDLIRTGKALEVMTAHGIRMKALYGFLLPTAFNVNLDKLIYPIPYRELQINKLIEQNHGY